MNAFYLRHFFVVCHWKEGKIDDLLACKSAWSTLIQWTFTEQQQISVFVSRVYQDYQLEGKEPSFNLGKVILSPPALSGIFESF